MPKTLAICIDTPLAFDKAAQMQNALVLLRVEDKLPDMVFCLEHTPVITLGNRGRTNHVLLSPAELDRRGISLIHANRGGDVTYHGPGQLILYPIIRLGSNEADAHGYLYNLEETAIRTAADFGIQAFRRAGKTGAWSDSGKFAAIGIRFKRWVTFHGMSFNVAPDLTGFQTIVPCGLTGESVTSLEQMLPDCPSMEAVRAKILQHFSVVFRRPLETHTFPFASLPANLREFIMAAMPLKQSSEGRGEC